MTEPGIFREIQEDMERERINALWRSYGPLLLIAALLIVAGAAGYTFWHSSHVEANQKATAGLISVLEKPDAAPDAKLAQLEAFGTENHGKAQAVIAQLAAGNLALKQGNKEKAVQLFDAVAHDDKAEAAFRQFGDLMAVEAQMDSGEPKTLDDRLKTLEGNDQPWRYSATEARAYLALRAGDKDAAKTLFTALSQDSAAPPTLSARSGEILRLLADSE